MQNLFKDIFSLSPEIRYCALYHQGKLVSEERASLQGASSSESDKYEELIVNPTLLTLAQQRGNIDCGGAKFVMIRYGNFFEYVQPINEGHVSIGIELNGNPFDIAPLIDEVLRRYALL